jgi:hypothetical protein
MYYWGKVGVFDRLGPYVLCGTSLRRENNITDFLSIQSKYEPLCPLKNIRSKNLFKEAHSSLYSCDYGRKKPP